MGWVKLDDKISSHPKFLQAGPSAAWLWVCCLTYCQAHSTGGLIPHAALHQMFTYDSQQRRRAIKRLSACGLFDITPNGFAIHDYLDFNETREAGLERRFSLKQVRSKAGKAGGIASGIARSNEAKRKQVIEAKRSPDPTRPYVQPPNPLRSEGGTPLRILRSDRQEAKRLLKVNFGRCTHDPGHVDAASCEAEIAAALAERRRDAEDQALGSPFRARQAHQTPIALERRTTETDFVSREGETHCEFEDPPRSGSHIAQRKH